MAHPGADVDDRVLPLSRTEALLQTDLIVEEKLDGFNIAIARDAYDWPKPYARSGKTEADRGGQLGRIRAFMGAEQPALDALLESWPVVYAEWLMRQHSVVYDALPSWLVVLDLWSPSEGFAGASARDLLCKEVGLCTPPRLYVGAIRNIATLETLVLRSQFGSGPAEGVVLREPLVGAPPSAKWLSPSFRRRSDHELSRAGKNQLRLP
jgi:hypothetical protein